MDPTAALERLSRERHWWLTTVRPDGRPHAAPVWGVVVDGVPVMALEPTTVKAANVRHEPRVVVHLEPGDDVLIAEGTLEELPEAARADATARFGAKYDRAEDAAYLPEETGWPFQMLRVTRWLSWDAAGDYAVQSWHAD